MTTRLNPYVSFNGHAREAAEFYRSVLGGELEMNTYGESGMGDSSESDKIMHAQVATAGGLVIMISDAPASMPTTAGGPIAISLSGDDLDELTGYWSGLCDGATVIEPFVTAPWGDTFGICRDRFGVTWMVNAAGAPQ